MRRIKEKNELHLIIDRLLEASGYDTNTASAEDFEDVYEQMRYEQQQLNQYNQALDEIEKLMPKFEDSTECAYGDFDCGNCSSLDEDTVCTYKLKKNNFTHHPQNKGQEKCLANGVQTAKKSFQ